MEDLTREELIAMLDAAICYLPNLKYIELYGDKKGDLKVFTKQQFESQNQSGLVNGGMTLKVQLEKKK